MILHLTERFNIYMIVKPLPNYYVSHHVHFQHIMPFTAHFTEANLFYVILLYNRILYCPNPPLSIILLCELAFVQYTCTLFTRFLITPSEQLRSVGLHIRTPRTYNPMHKTCNIQGCEMLKSSFRRKDKKRQITISAIVTAQAGLAEPVSLGTTQVWNLINEISYSLSLELDVCQII